MILEYRLLRDSSLGHLRSNTDIVKTVLLVDDNLGFAFWLGQALDRAGYETWPARSVPAAESLLKEVPLAIDLLVINATLPLAPAFATNLCRTRTDFKVIAVYE